MACLSVEARQLEVALRYHEHQSRLADWIRFLLDRATDILLEDATYVETDEFAQKKSRATSGLQIAARQLFATATQLSKEQLSAAQALARMDFTTQKVVADTSAEALAREQAAMAEMHVRQQKECVGKPDWGDSCGDERKAPQRQATTDASEIDPWRANHKEGSKPLDEPLPRPLAREAEKAFEDLSGQEVNDAVRRHRRRRAKELERAKTR